MHNLSLQLLRSPANTVFCLIGLIAKKQYKRHNKQQQRRGKKISVLAYSRRRTRRWVLNHQKVLESRMQKRRVDLASRVRAAARGSECDYLRCMDLCLVVLSMFPWKAFAILPSFHVVSSSSCSASSRYQGMRE